MRQGDLGLKGKLMCWLLKIEWWYIHIIYIYLYIHTIYGRDQKTSQLVYCFLFDVLIFYLMGNLENFLSSDLHLYFHAYIFSVIFCVGKDAFFIPLHVEPLTSSCFSRLKTKHPLVKAKSWHVAGQLTGATGVPLRNHRSSEPDPDRRGETLSRWHHHEM